MEKMKNVMENHGIFCDLKSTNPEVYLYRLYTAGSHKNQHQMAFGIEE